MKNKKNKNKQKIECIYFLMHLEILQYNIQHGRKRRIPI